MLASEFADWEVVGPEGEYYGRFKTRPKESSLPIYARIVEARNDQPPMQFFSDASDSASSWKVWFGAAAALSAGLVAGYMWSRRSR